MSNDDWGVYFIFQWSQLLVAYNYLTTFQEDPNESEFALDGLKQVMAVKSRVILPYLVPQVC